MAIRVQCPNAACSHVISVRDEYAGKRGKCPACGSAMMIPVAAGRESAAPTPFPPLRPRSDPLVDSSDTTGPSPATPVDDIRLPPADSLASLPPLEPSPPPAPTAAPAPTPSNPVLGYTMAELSTRTALIIAIVSLLLISFLPQLRWLHISGGGEEARLARRDAEDYLAAFMLSAGGSGTALLIYSGLLALLGIGCIVALDLLPREIADSLVAATGGLAGGWGVTVFLLVLAYLWKAFTTASEFAHNSRPIWPGFGLIIGLFAALALTAVSTYLVVQRRRFLWLAVAGGLGFFFGLFLVLFSARPWSPWPLPL